MALEFEIEDIGLESQDVPPTDTTDDGLNNIDTDINIDSTDDTNDTNDTIDTDDTNDDVVEDPIYLSILEKSGLEFTDEELATLKDDEEGIINAATLIANKKAETQYNSFLSTNERIKQYNDFVAKNEGDPDTFFKSVEKIADVKNIELSETSVDVNRNIVRRFYKEKGFNDSMIEKQITLLENSDSLFDTAKDLKSELVKSEETRHAQLIAEQEQLSVAQKEERDSYTKQFKEIADKGVVSNIPLSATEKTELFDYMFVPDKDGKTKYQEDSSKLTAEQIMTIGLLVKRGLKLEGVIKKAAESQTSSSLRDRLRAVNKTSNVGGKKNADISKLELEDIVF